MYDDRNTASFSGKYDRDRYEAAFGKDNVRLQDLHKFFRFVHALKNTEWVGKILETEIAAELSGGNPMIRDAELLNQFLLDSVIGADIVDIIVQLLKTGKESNVGSNMTGGAAAS